MGFSENLYHLRAARNMTQEQLAMLMGVSRQAISKWESARAYPEMDKLVRLCDIFACDLNELVRGDVSEIDSHPELAVPSGAAHADICGYDRCMRACALMMATAAAIPLLGLATFFGTSGTILYDDPVSSGISVAPLIPLVRNSPFGFPVLVVSLLIGLGLLSVSLNRYLGFCSRFPHIEDFYSDEQQGQTHTLVRRARFVAAAVGIVAVTACAVKSGPLFHLSGGLTSLFAWGAVATWLLIYASLMSGRLNIARYNQRNAETLSERSAASMYAGLPEYRTLMRANPEIPQLAKKWAKRQATVIAVAILVGFSIVAGVFALMGWHIWFIPLIVGAVAATLIWSFLPLTR